MNPFSVTKFFHDWRAWPWTVLGLDLFVGLILAYQSTKGRYAAIVASVSTRLDLLPIYFIGVKNYCSCIASKAAHKAPHSHAAKKLVPRITSR
jgi:hypothetical protein